MLKEALLVPIILNIIIIIIMKITKKHDRLSSKSFIYQQAHFISVLENIKIYMKTYIKIAPTCFGLRPSSGAYI